MSGRPQKPEDLKKKEPASNLSDYLYVRGLIMAAVEKGYYFNKPPGEIEKLQSKPLPPEGVVVCKQLLGPLSSYETGEGAPPVIYVTPKNETNNTQQIIINLSSLPLKDYQKTGTADWVHRNSRGQESSEKFERLLRTLEAPVGAPVPQQPVPRVGAPVPKTTPIEQSEDLNSIFSSRGFLQQRKTYNSVTDTYTVTYIKPPENKSGNRGAPGSAPSLPLGYVPQKTSHDPKTDIYTLTLVKASPTTRPGHFSSPITYDPVTGTHTAIIRSQAENKQPARGVGVSGQPTLPLPSIQKPIPKSQSSPKKLMPPTQNLSSTPNMIRGSSAPLPKKPTYPNVYGSNLLAPGQGVVALETPEQRPRSRLGEPSPLSIGATPEPFEPPQNSRIPSAFFATPSPSIPENKTLYNRRGDSVFSGYTTQDQKLKDQKSQQPLRVISEQELTQNPYKDMKYVPSAPYVPRSLDSKSNVKIPVSNFFTRQFLVEERAKQLSGEHTKQLQKNGAERLQQIQALLAEEKARTQRTRDQILASQRQGTLSTEHAAQLLAEEKARTENLTHKLLNEDLECIQLLLPSEPPKKLISQGDANTALKLFSLIERGDFAEVQKLLPAREKSFLSLFSHAKRQVLIVGNTVSAHSLMLRYCLPHPICQSRMMPLKQGQGGTY